MNTSTRTNRLAVAATVVALAASLAGCATAEPAVVAGGNDTRVAAAAPIAPEQHRALVRESADRYVRELEDRALLAARSPHEAADRYVRELEARAGLAARSPHEAADRYVRELLVRACMAAGSVDVTDCLTR
ncbi:hypothetical protein [Agromyces bracchium]|uniref:hypothetical protein n=1 Tax=Agromyces bracchium TaxID=88376 RepID=UPI0018ACF30D|nr:hypothetical protein [Agromyces bracchium]